ncbi:GDPD-domain-containing protein [Lophiostoma macrostomum CBS 122681]|uniref:GDPD-domain-containing protein n=1 Tax=Lophiostoma macrostomum CBS 122681 TaxID=1314788 RepID=A0A6A6SUI5_9PLEO|nr:GDPD-domain-containing protein [Lophiostoma macrostomum CBS 122681]
MRFSRHFQEQRWVDWEHHHIPYQRLKALLKHAKRQGEQPSEDFYEAFRGALSASEKFLDHHHDVLEHRQEQMQAFWTSATDARSYQNYVARIGYTHLPIDYAMIGSFCRLNIEAVSRIQAKFQGLEQYHEQRPGGQTQRASAWSTIDTSAWLQRLDYYLVHSQEKNRELSADPGCVDATKTVDIDTLNKMEQRPFIIEDTLQRSGDRTDERWETAQFLFRVCIRESLLTEHCKDIFQVVFSRPTLFSFNNDHAAYLLRHSVFFGRIECTDYILSQLHDLSFFNASDLLYTAISQADGPMVDILFSRSIGLAYKSPTGETCWHAAARSGRVKYVDLLLSAPASMNFDTAEAVHEWTPLFLACIDSHELVVKRLLQAGADPTLVDNIGWTTREHAAFRGHPAIAQLLPTNESPWIPPLQTTKDDHYTNLSLEPGHSQIIIHLGGLQEGKASEFINLMPTVFSGTRHLGYGMMLEISTAVESSKTYRRPITHGGDPADDPMVFSYNNLYPPMLIFKLLGIQPGPQQSSILLGSGVALAQDRSDRFGKDHESLIREQTIPLLDRDSMREVGKFTFSFLIVKPYKGLETPRTGLESLREGTDVTLIGHRGLGMNNASHRHLQLGENTIGSLLSASTLGADYVEFDVQLTRDHVPILFHDFSLSESGTDIPIHDVTLEQFMHAGKIQSPHGDPPNRLGRPRHRESSSSGRRARSLSRSFETGAEQVNDRMKHTVDYKTKGFKSNTRGNFIQDVFATLKDTLCSLPESVGFDLELKYSRLHEFHKADMAPITIEINTFVDTILDALSQYAGNRRIFLSSFTPEICIALSLKQKAYPIFYITAARRPMIDMEKRTSSLQVASRFARKWGLAGLVVYAESVVMCPRLIGEIQAKGLMIGTFGQLNDVPENVELQVKGGIDFIIADRVGLVGKTLKGLGAHK